jgi:hypothetical protein
MANDDEPTWGDSYPNPGAAASPSNTGPAPGHTIPNQQSMPVIGSGHSTPRIGQPHADYHRQAQQHFGAGQPPATPYPPASPYPAVTPPAAGYPPAYPPPQAPRPSYGSHAPGPARDSFMIRLMERGVRGELFRQPWFHNLRGRSPDPFVFATFAGGVVLSILLGLIPSTFLSTLLILAVWAAIGYSYLALGTRLSHQFLEFGICLVGAIVMLWRALVTVTTLAADHSLARYLHVYVEPAPVLVLVLLIDVATAAFLIYAGLQLHRGIQRLSQP